MSNTPPRSGFDVRLADSDEEREAIYRFRYQTLVHDMAWGSADADDDAAMVRDALDDEAAQLYVSHHGEVIGALRLILGAPDKLPESLRKALVLDRFDTFPPNTLSMSDRLLVASAWQNSPITSLLLGAAYKTARRFGCRFDFTYCAPSVLELYEQLGYRRHADNFAGEDGYRVPLVLLLEDERHLQELNSPFIPIAKEIGGNDLKSAGWFDIEFAEYATRPIRRKMSDQRFWNFLTTRLHQTPLVGIPILAGLSYDEAKRFLSLGTTIVCNDGDTVVGAGEHGREMYVVLSGEVEVRSPGRGAKLATLGRGAVFGEMALLSAEPRTADVIARGTVEVIVLNESFLHKTMTAVPQVTAKVLYALSVILCNRLRRSNNRWVAAVVGRAIPGRAARKNSADDAVTGP